MTSRDGEIKLAEALRLRAEGFAQSNDLKNALLDIGACYYLLRNQGDERAREVHTVWTTLYQQYARSGERDQTPESDNTIMRLERLLTRVQGARIRTA